MGSPNDAQRRVADMGWPEGHPYEGVLSIATDAPLGRLAEPTQTQG